MVDTLSQNRINSLLNNNSFHFPKDSVTEPDNGTKDFKLESERLKTFKNFDTPLIAEDLAKFGLYLHDNKAKCAFCDIEINFSALTKNVLDDHLKWSPSCPFARGKIGQRTLSTFLRALPADQDVCGNVDTFTDSVRLLSKLVHPYEDLETRKKSFETWPESCKQKPQDLAEAGFYYRGVGDKTVCFHCGGPLNSWEDQDDPWEQHALWFPKCEFLLKEKGEEFVRGVQKKLKICTKTETGQDPVDEEKMCRICFDNKREVVFVPCGHDLTCLKCVRSLEDKKCPICREQIVRMKNL